MFVGFSVEPDRLIEFMIACAKTGAEQRFDGFLRSWKACARLRGDKRQWMTAIYSDRASLSGRAGEVFDEWKRRLLEGIGKDHYPIASDVDESCSVVDLWRDAEGVLDGLGGASCVLGKPFLSQFGSISGPLVREWNVARVVDRYALSKEKGNGDDLGGLRSLLGYLASRGVTEVEVAAAVSTKMKPRCDLQEDVDVRRVVRAVKSEISDAMRVVLRLRTYHSMCARAHDRFLAVCSPQSEDAGAAVQIGPGIRSFTDTLQYPITVSRVPMPTFNRIWSPLVGGKGIIVVEV